MLDFRDEQGSVIFAGISRGLWPLEERVVGYLTRASPTWERFLTALASSEIRRLFLAVCPTGQRQENFVIAAGMRK